MAAGEIIAFTWIGCALGTAVIAQNKKRNGCGWFALGVATGPVGLVVSLAVPKAKPKEPPRAPPDEATPQAEGEPPPEP